VKDERVFKTELESPEENSETDGEQPTPEMLELVIKNFRSRL